MKLARWFRLAPPLLAAALILGSCTQPNAGSSLPFGDFARAGVVIGQPDFTTNATNLTAAGMGSSSGDPALANGVLYVPDTSQDRVLGFLGGIPTTSGAGADFALGEPDLTTDSPSATSGGMSGPRSVAASGGKLFVDDIGNNRVLGWNALPTSSGAPASFVVGQLKFGDTAPNCTATALNSPTSVFAYGSMLLIADSVNNRVLIYTSLPGSSGASPDLVLGQSGRSTCAANDDNQDGTNDGAPTARTLNYPTDVWTDGTHVVVTDTFNDRVLIWQTFPTGDFQRADVVLGQAVMSGSAPAAGASGMNQPMAVAGNDSQLFVADSANNRVLIFDGFPTANGADASHVLGQSDFAHTTANDDNQDGSAGAPSARTFWQPSGLLVTNNALMVVDQFNQRVLVFTP